MTLEKPIVSVIVPVYNAEKTIAKCVESILAQTFTDYELLLINDGSKDNSLAVLRDYEERYEQIRVIDKPNEGVAVTRNKAIDWAQGDYILFMDNDDFIDQDYISVFYKEITDKNLDIVVGGYRRVTANKVLFQVKLTSNSWDKFLVISPWAKIYRKSFLKENDITFLDYILGEDVYFNLNAYSKTMKIASISYIGYNWYDNEISVSNTIHKGFKKEADILYLLEALYESIPTWSPLMVYYLKRFSIYYLLYSGKTASAELFVHQFERTVTWLKEHQLLSTITVFDRQVTSERFRVKIILWLMEKIYHWRLLPLFARCYCRGRSE